MVSNEKDFNTWQDLRSRIKNTITRDDFKILCRLHADNFNHKYNEFCTCNKSLLRKWIKDLEIKFKK